MVKFLYIDFTHILIYFTIFILSCSKLFELENYLKEKLVSDPDYKSYLDGSYYRKIYLKKEENRKKSEKKADEILNYVEVNIKDNDVRQEFPAIQSEKDGQDILEKI